MGEMAYGRDRGRGWGVFGDLDWGAIVASVVAGMGLTLLLATLGAAAGIEAADDDGGDDEREPPEDRDLPVARAPAAHAGGEVVGTLQGGHGVAPSVSVGSE